MLDLIKTAYRVDADTVFGGPSWLDWDRFDVIAKVPPATSSETVGLMLQALLADRFKLVVRFHPVCGPKTPDPKMSDSAETQPSESPSLACRRFHSSHCH